MAKRAANNTQAEGAKKMRIDPIVKKCHEVVAALTMPSEVAALLMGSVPLALGQCVEHRHKFQHGVVEFLATELNKNEASKQAMVDGLIEKQKQVVAEKEAQEAKIAELSAAWEQSQQRTKEAKNVLAEVAGAFQRSKAALAGAEAAHVAGEKQIETTKQKCAALEELLQGQLRSLLEGTEEEAAPKASALIPMLQALMDLDESLAASIPLVLSKPPSARGQFDMLATQKLEEDVKTAVVEMKETIDNGQPARQQRLAAIEAARVAHEEAKQIQMSKADTFLVTRGESDKAGLVVREAQGVLKKIQKTLIPKAEKELKAAERELTGFRVGPMATFAELRDRTEVLPPVVVDPEPDAAMPTACATDVPAVVPEVPMVQEVA